MKTVTKELAELVDKAEMDALLSRLKAIQGIEGNPMGAEIEYFGSATAFSVKHIPGPAFNVVKGEAGPAYIFPLAKKAEHRQVFLPIKLPGKTKKGSRIGSLLRNYF